MNKENFIILSIQITYENMPYISNSQLCFLIVKDKKMFI